MRTRAILVTAAALLVSSCSGPGTPAAKTAAKPAALPGAAARPAMARLEFAPEPVPEEEPATASFEDSLLAADDLPPIPVPADGEIRILGVPLEEKPLLFGEGFLPGDVAAPDLAAPPAAVLDAPAEGEPLLFADGWQPAADAVEEPALDGELAEEFEPAAVEEIVYDEGVQAGEQTIYVDTPVLVIRGYTTLAYGRFPAVCSTRDWDPCPTPGYGAWWTTSSWDPCWNPCADPRYRSWDEYWRCRDEGTVCATPVVGTPVVGKPVVGNPVRGTPVVGTPVRPACDVGPIYSSRPPAEPATRAPRVRDGDYVRTQPRPETPRTAAPFVPPAAAVVPSHDAVSAGPGDDTGFRVRGPRGRAEKPTARDADEGNEPHGRRIGAPVASASDPAPATAAHDRSRREGVQRRGNEDGDAAPARGHRRDTDAPVSRREDADSVIGRGARDRGDRDGSAAATPRNPVRGADVVREPRRGDRDADASPGRSASRGPDRRAEPPAAAPVRETPPAAPAAPAVRSDPTPARGHSRGADSEAPPAPPSRGRK